MNEKNCRIEKFYQTKAYSIERNLNNHVALVKDEVQKDFIVFGRAIAYGKKTGQMISEADVTNQKKI